MSESGVPSFSRALREGFRLYPIIYYIYLSVYLCMMLWLHVHLRHDGNNYLIYRSYSSSTTGHVIIVVWSSQSTGIRLETSDEDTEVPRKFCQLEVHIPHSAPRNKQSPFQACWTTMPRCSMVLKYLPLFIQNNGPNVGIYSSTMELKRWINHGKKKQRTMSPSFTEVVILKVGRDLACSIAPEI